MNIMRLVICVFAMALVTYLIRMLPITFFRKSIKNKYIKTFLNYVPYAVLGAMTFPDVLYSTGNIIAGLCGLIVALLLAYREKGLLTVACFSCVTAFIAQKILEITI